MGMRAKDGVAWGGQELGGHRLGLTGRREGGARPGLALSRGWRSRSWALREVDREMGRTPRPNRGEALGAGCRDL